VQSITVEIERGAAWQLRYRIRGRIDDLVVFPTGAGHARDRRGQGPLLQAIAPARRDGLWRHTCCEAFIADADGPGYREFNFAPSGEWAAYRFDDYRGGMREQPCPAPRIAAQATAEEFVLEATIADPGPHGALGLCCVIEERYGKLAYWALAHPGERPDFHHRGGFVLPASSAA
jgi:hypothetical protein